MFCPWLPGLGSSEQPTPPHMRLSNLLCGECQGEVMDCDGSKANFAVAVRTSPTPNGNPGRDSHLLSTVSFTFPLIPSTLPSYVLGMVVGTSTSLLVIWSLK